VTGDVTQVDLDSDKLSGLRTIRRVLRGISGIAFIELTGADVVRHRIVAAIVEAYRQYEERRKEQEA